MKKQFTGYFFIFEIAPTLYFLTYFRKQVESSLTLKNTKKSLIFSFPIFVILLTP